MIPKVVHWCWISGDELPELIQKCVNSWKEKLRDWQILLWDKDKIDIENSCTWVKQAYNAREYAFIADYVRFYALYNYGGIYLDSDVEVLKSFDDLLTNRSFFGYEYSGMPEAAVLGSQKGQQWCKTALDFYLESDFLNKDGTYNRVIAPLVLKRAFEKTECVKLLDLQKSVKVNDVLILPYNFFSAKNSFTGKITATKDTYSIHHTTATWLTHSFKKKIKDMLKIILISVLGKLNYNKLMYKIRSDFKVCKG